MTKQASEYLSRSMTPAAAETMAAIEAGPMPAGQALRLDQLDRLLDPTPFEYETGWCVLPDGVVYVAVRTPMPEVSGEMVDWWFDWHQREPVRYRIWYPGAHESTSFDPPSEPGPKAHWGATHYPVEDVGIGMAKVRIEFVRPTEIGFSTDALDDPDVATIICGWTGDNARRMRAGPMVHTFLRDRGGVTLRSRFWVGATMRPYAPRPVASLVGGLVNNRVIRRAVLPRGLGPALASHCAREYANFATLVPELYAEFG